MAFFFAPPAGMTTRPALPIRRPIDLAPSRDQNTGHMTEPSSPSPVKLICGMISSHQPLFDQARPELEALLGPVDLASEIMDFDFTHYYDEEMGSPLYRQFLSFASLRSPEALAEIKLATNALEKRFASRQAGGPRRPINLDPGYLESSKLVLASMKNFSHRIYLSRGVYGEVTLLYHKGGWQSFPFTFPDFASERYRPFLDAARTLLRQQLGPQQAS